MESKKKTKMKCFCGKPAEMKDVGIGARKKICTGCGLLVDLCDCGKPKV